jgi:exodeoxyribonuclease VII large subunit
MLNTIKRRYPLAEVLLAPTPVQGIDAPAGIVRSLDLLAADGRSEVILLARGGGSIEDLWGFNDESVVRAIAASPIPVVTGIGHETDFTLADFVSDLRAPTPTAAAELVTPDRIELQSAVREAGDHLDRFFGTFVDGARLSLMVLANQLERETPDARVANERQRLDDRVLRAGRAVRAILDRSLLRVESAQARLETVNPVAVLQRGYSIVTDGSGRIVSSVRQAAAGVPLNVQVQDGAYAAVVAKPTEG